MSLSSFFGNLLGGGGKQAKPDWAQIEKLMKLETELNRTNRQGVFGGWDWSVGEDGTWTQKQNLAPGMQGGADRLMNRAVSGQGMDPYKSPEQFSRMLDASMANFQNRMKMQPGYTPPQDLGYGPSAASQQPQPPPQPAVPNNLSQPPAPPPQPPPPMGGMPGRPGGRGPGRPNMPSGPGWEEFMKRMQGP